MALLGIRLGYFGVGTISAVSFTYRRRVTHTLIVAAERGTVIGCALEGTGLSHKGDVKLNLPLRVVIYFVVQGRRIFPIVGLEARRATGRASSGI